ncbi:MAG: DHH family phosphoesterase [Chitinispirillales bacterium]|jgi:nanoRNase/pAp phosphatase (c-di-AMP/oligoRNAs hydrolase)|nr:DHH family phosphoesterase [Chitinispirillales bacterium]
MRDKYGYNHKLRGFREAVMPASSVLILTHDYPDPDCLASACGISELLSFWGVTSSVISFGGFIGRAENRAMIRLLNINIIPFVLTEITEFDKIVLVDCYPGQGNVSLPPDIAIHAVIDHHHNVPPPDAPFFYDIRENYGAATTIVTSYLIEAKCPVPPKLATALFYGINADTGGMRRNVSDRDIECYRLMFDIMDYRLLSEIQNPDREVEFFRMLNRATGAAVTYDNVGYTHLGNVTAPDYISEMADLIHSLEKLEWTVCTGIFKNQLYFSIRSKSNSAGVMAQRLAAAMGGNGGGRLRAAAGQLPIKTEINILLAKLELSIREIFNIKDAPKESLL